MVRAVETHPLGYGNDLRDMRFPRESPLEEAIPQPAWKDPEEWQGQKKWLKEGSRLYRVTWRNPHPETPVESLDFVSAMSASAPFLIGVTTE